MSESILRRVFIFQNGGGDPIEVYIKLTTDSIETLNNTISSCSDGSVIYFEEGLHVVDEPIVVNRSHIRLEGVSGKTILRNDAVLGSNGLLQVKGTANDSRIYDIQISGFIIDGYLNGSRTGRGVEIKYCGVGFNNTTAAYNSAIVGSAYQNQIGVIVSDLIIRNNSLHGILIYNSENVVVEKCNVLNNAQNGVYLYVDSYNCSIVDNIIQNNGTYGIFLSTSSNDKISDNIIQNNAGHGLYVNGSSNNVFTSNTIQNNANIGVYIVSSLSNAISGNTIQNNNGRGIYINTSSEGNNIIGNTIQNNVSYGLQLNASLRNNVIGNTIQNNGGRGIYVSTSNQNIISSNVSRVNTTYDIQIADSTSSKNTLSFNQTSLAIVNDGTSTTIDNNVTG